MLIAGAQQVDIDIANRARDRGFADPREHARGQAIQRKLPASGLPISTSLGVLGLNGLAAHRLAEANG